MPKRSLPNQNLIEQLDQAVSQLLASPVVTVQSAEPELLPLLHVAAQLRQLPREDFRTRLKADLERKSSMATVAEPVAAIRQAAAPYMTFKDAARAIDFYKKAFGAVEIARLAEPSGKIGHAQISISGSTIMLADEYPDYDAFSPTTLGGSPVKMHLYVEDVDAFVERAVSAGAKILGAVADQFYGDRAGRLLDPFGYTWTIATPKNKLSMEEIQRRFTAMAPAKKKPAVDPVPKGYTTLTTYLVAQDADGLIDFVKKTFDGEELFRSGPGSEGGLHAEVRIGDSMLMIGGGAAGMKWSGTPMPSAFHIYVPNCDSTYARALEAGATSVHGPTDQAYGERSATVKDATGNFWYIATYKGESYRWEGAPTLQPYLHPRRVEPVINFMRRAFGAEELGRYTAPDGVVAHTTIKVGNAYMEMGEAHDAYEPMPTMFYLYVEDCDALYRRALQAGATSISAPQDHPYGDRSGGVIDPFGNKWYIATHVKDVSM